MSITRARAARAARFQQGLIGMTLLMLATFYFFAYRPTGQRLSQVHNKITGNLSELNVSRDQLGDIASLTAEVGGLREQLAPFPPMRKEHELGTFIREADDAAKRCNLREISYHPQPKMSQGGFAEMPVQINFEGDYFGAMKFLRELECLPRTLRTTALSIVAKDAWQGTVDVKLTVKLYSTEG